MWKKGAQAAAGPNKTTVQPDGQTARGDEWVRAEILGLGKTVGHKTKNALEKWTDQSQAEPTKTHKI